MPEWLMPVLSIVGAVVGGYLGVRIAVTRLQTQMEGVLPRIKELGDRSHDHTAALLRLDGRVTALERRGIER